MLKNILNKLVGPIKASAHCDVPCGIYDPISAQIDALTVVRMLDQMKELSENKEDTMSNKNKMARLVMNKEKHAEKAKHEIRIIWGDFIKEEHVEKYPEINNIVHQVMILGSKCKQEVDRENGIKFLEKINEFAQIFWDIKGVETFVKDAPYLPNLPVVYHK